MDIIYLIYQLYLDTDLFGPHLVNIKYFWYDNGILAILFLKHLSLLQIHYEILINEIRRCQEFVSK